MYRTRQIQVKKGHKLYPYFREICIDSAKLYNRGNYLIRQYATSIDRLENRKELTENQKEAYEFICTITNGTKYGPKSKWLNYGQLDYILKTSQDISYCNLPAQANQQILKKLVCDYKSFFEALKVYKVSPQLFTGRPRLPKYRKKESMITAILTNQICRIKEQKMLRFPGTKTMLNIGIQAEDTKLKEVRVKPHSNCFVVDVVLEVTDATQTSNNPLLLMNEAKLKAHLSTFETTEYRIASIDPGMTNICAVTNNFGEQPFLIRGGALKSMNQYYNKKLAILRSEAKRCNNRYCTKRILQLHDRRNRIVKDRMHKISRAIVNWAVENKVDLVVLGHNIFQKQEIAIGHANNQNFVQIPFCVLAGMLRYKLEEAGIAMLETEESYTSKADFLSMDAIPKYEEAEKAPKMSGKRIKRGLYRHLDGTISNADINGAANILRKALPNVIEWDRGVVDTPYVLRIA